MAITKIQSESLNLADDFAFTGTITGAGGVNTPAFGAKVTSNFSFADDTTTLIPYATVEFDTHSAYNNTAGNYKFTVPSGQGGKYAINMGLRLSNDRALRLNITLHVNNTSIHQFEFSNTSNASYSTVNGNYVYTLNAGDYIQVKGYLSYDGSNADIFALGSYFQAYKLIGV